MATSGSVDFSSTKTEAIKDALVMVGGIEDEGTPSSEQNAYCSRILNRMLKAWSVRGLKLWKWTDLTISLVDGQAAYELGPTGDEIINRPVAIRDPRRVVDSVETEIRLVSRSEYMNQPSKDSEGEPVFVYYDPQLTNGVLYVWPTPADSLNSIKLSYKSYIEDMDDPSDNFEFPVEWEEAIVYGLAMRLIPKYEVKGEDAARITDMAMAFLNDAEINDADTGSVFLQPELYA